MEFKIKIFLKLSLGGLHGILFYWNLIFLLILSWNASILIVTEGVMITSKEIQYTHHCWHVSWWYEINWIMLVLFSFFVGTFYFVLFVLNSIFVVFITFTLFFVLSQRLEIALREHDHCDQVLSSSICTNFNVYLRHPSTLQSSTRHHFESVRHSSAQSKV